MLERQAGMGPAGRTFKLSLSFIRYFFTRNICDGDPVLLLAQERDTEERHNQLQQGRVALLPATIALLVAPDVNQQQARPAGLQRPRVHVVHLVVPSLCQPDQAGVLHASVNASHPWR